MRYKTNIYFILSQIIGYFYARMFYFQFTRDTENNLLNPASVHFPTVSSTILHSRLGILELHEPLIFLFQILIFLFCISIFLVYNMPIQILLSRGAKHCTKELIQQAQKRVLRITWLGVLLSWLSPFLLFLLHLGSELYFYKTLRGVDVLSIFCIWMAMGIISKAIVSTWIDQHILSIMPLIFPSTQSYKIRKDGKPVFINSRFFAMIFAVSVIPLAYIFLLSLRDTELKTFLITLEKTRSFSYFLENFHTFIPSIITIVIILLSLFLVITMSFCLRYSFLLPLFSLTRKMETIAEKEDFEYSRVYTNDEIGRLKHSYNLLVDTLKQKIQMKKTFSRFMSEEVSETILNDGKISLGGEEVIATVLFTDIRGFTTLSEKLSPPEVVAFLNDFFSYAIAAITEHQGVVNKYIGDCVMVLFGVPKRNEHHADNAVMAGLKLRNALIDFNHDRKKRGLEAIEIGVGIHTGPVVAGNIGDKSRLEYTVIGDTVNVASRIESKTKELDTDLLISKEVIDAMSQRGKNLLKFEPCENIHVKGKSKPLDLFKVHYV